MRILIVIGLIVIFISTFFILFTIDSLTTRLACAADDVACYRGTGIPILLSLLVLGVFVVIDVFAVYLMVTSLRVLDFPVSEL